jgi:hypothetical protein
MSFFNKGSEGHCSLDVMGTIFVGDICSYCSDDGYSLLLNSQFFLVSLGHPLDVDTFAMGMVVIFFVIFACAVW